MAIGSKHGAWRSVGRLLALSTLMSAAPVGLQALADETALEEQAELLGVPGVEELAVDADAVAPVDGGAPHEPRTLALRKLWRSTPTFGAPDGLDDYDDDFATVRPIRK